MIEEIINDPVVKRGSRELLGIAITGVVYWLTSDPKFIALKPIISVLGKYLREKGFNYIPV